MMFADERIPDFATSFRIRTSNATETKTAGKEHTFCKCVIGSDGKGSILNLPLRISNLLHRNLYIPLLQTTSPSKKCGQLDILLKALPNSIFSHYCPLGKIMSGAVV